MSPSEQIFEFVSNKEFIEMGNKYLNNLTIALLNPATKVDNNKQIQEMFRTYHDDPIQGGHYGINKTLNKIKRHFSGQT